MPPPDDPDIGITPVPKPDPDYARFVDDQGARCRRRQPDLLFVGDSITWNWTLDGPEFFRRLRPVWEYWYGDRRAGLLGCGGDQTQNLLWRIARGQLDGLAPRLAVLLIGTNNIAAGQQTPEQATRGVLAVARAMLDRLPTAHLLLLEILPRGPAAPWARAREVNARVRDALAGAERVTVLDIGGAFLRDGQPDRSLYLEDQMPQHAPVHPNAAGAEAMARALEPAIARLLGDRDRRRDPVPPLAHLRPVDLVRLIDHTILRPDASSNAVQTACTEALQHGFRTVCVNPVQVPLASSVLRGSAVGVCSVAGFPFGAGTSAVKAAEAAQAVADGAAEIDMVLDLGALKDTRHDAVRRDIVAVRDACPGRVLKVIIEACLLTEAEKETACRIAAEAGADFVKTSTGFSTAGATPADVALMRRVVGPLLGVKASGGVRHLDAAKKMLTAGASRLGCGASVAILAEAEAQFAGSGAGN